MSEFALVENGHYYFPTEEVNWKGKQIKEKKTEPDLEIKTQFLEKNNQISGIPKEGIEIFEPTEIVKRGQVSTNNTTKKEDSNSKSKSKAKKVSKNDKTLRGMKREAKEKRCAF